MSRAPVRRRPPGVLEHHGELVVSADGAEGATVTVGNRSWSASGTAELTAVLTEVIQRHGFDRVTDRFSGTHQHGPVVFEHLFPPMAARGSYQLTLRQDAAPWTDELVLLLAGRPVETRPEACLHRVARYVRQTAVGAHLDRADSVLTITKDDGPHVVLESLPLSELTDAVTTVRESEPYLRVPADVRPRELAGRVAPIAVPGAVVDPPAMRVAELTDVVTVGDGVLIVSGRYVVQESIQMYSGQQWRGFLYRVGSTSTHVLHLDIGGAPGVVAEAPVLLKQAWDANYGHWLVDALGRLAAVEEARGSLRGLTVVVSEARSPRLLRVYEESLAAVGVDANSVVFDGSHPRRWPTLTYPAPASIAPAVKHPAITRFLERMAIPADGAESLRLYVSRGEEPRRRLLNEDVVLGLLGDLGFTVVRADTVGFREQVELFSRADVVVGNMGAALTNLVFSPEGVRVVALATEAMSHDYFYDIACQKRGRYWAVQGTAVDAGRPSIASDFVVDEALVRAAVLEALGD